MEIKNINTFVKVVEFNNFTKAADNMGYSQAAVTVQIKALETELGVPLFDRIGKGIALTSEGKKFLPYAIDLLKAEEEARNSVSPSKELEGDLTICSASSYASDVLTETVRKFKTRHPKVNLIVKVSDYLEDNFLKLSRGEIDYLILLSEDRLFPEFDIAFKKKEPLLFVTGKSNPILKQQKITYDDIIKSDFIVTDRDIGYINLLEKELARKGLSLSPAMEYGSVSGIVNMILEGYGITYIPEFAAAPYLRDGQLVSISPEDIDLDIELFSLFIRSKERWVNPQMKAFKELLLSEYPGGSV